MNPEPGADAPRGGPQSPRRPPLQFSLRAMLIITAAVAVLFGTLRTLGVSPLASTIVLVILVISVLAALGLVVAIAAGDDDR